MKLKLIFLLILGAMTLNFNIDAQTGSSTGTKKILVAYFSHSGNTKAVAEQISKATGGDIFRIETVTAYPHEYNKLVDLVKREVESNYKPAIKDSKSDTGTYDIIFVGSPNWWGTIAPPVATFLSGHDLSGKTIIPFMTHEGSRMGHAVADIKGLCPGSTILDGFPVRGSNATSSQAGIKQWLQSIKIIK